MSSGIVESSSQDSQGTTGQTAQSGSPANSTVAAQNTSRSKLIQRLLAASANLPQFVNDLVTTQIVVVAGTEAAGFVIESRDGQASMRAIAHVRPDNSNAEARAAAIKAFQEIIKPVVGQNKDAGIVQTDPGDHSVEPQFCLITPLRSEGQIVAVSAVITRCLNLERAQQRLVSMQLVAGYFELYTLRRASEQSQVIAQSHQHVLQLATAVATAQGFESAAMNLCNELATRTGASRVTLGWIKGHDIKVRAVSHTEEFDKKQELIVQIERAMEECVDQEEPVLFDVEGQSSANVTRAAEVLSRAQGGNNVLSLPLRRHSETIGVVTLEFPGKHRLGAQASTGLAVAVDLLAPQLYDRYQNDRWLITKAGLSIKGVAEKAIGPQHMLAKLITVLSIAVAVAVTVIKIEYRVPASFIFDPINRASVDAPYEGYISEVFVEEGQSVKKGDVLMQLDIREPQIKLNEATAKAHEYLAEAQKDDADQSKTADAMIARKQADAALADAAEANRQIDLAKLKAPCDGVIIKGDWKDKRFTPVKKGDELFEVADPRLLRAEISVPERDIQQIAVGQTGELATSSLPTDKHKFLVDRIVPLGEAKEGDNLFKVFATISDVTTGQAPLSWKPGLAGEARIDIGKARVIWVWTHKLIEFVRIKLWAWF